MNNTITKTALLVVVLICTACNTVPVKQNAVTQYSNYDRGITAFQQYSKTRDKGVLGQSVDYLQKALVEAPDNVFVQKAHYKAQYEAVFLELIRSMREPDYTSLLAIYGQLHPAIQNEVPVPSRLAYAFAHAHEADSKEVEALLHQMVFEQPYNPANWLSLSEFYEENKQRWMAVVAADRAHQLNPDNAVIVYQLGDVINDVAQASECVYSQREYLKRSVFYMAKAAAKQPQPLYHNNTALQYMRLGLFPMGYQQAAKSWGIEQNRWSASRYAEATQLLERYDETVTAGEYFLNNENPVEGHLVLARVAVAQRKIKAALLAIDAIEESGNQNSQHRPESLTALQLSWVRALLSQKAVTPLLVKPRSNSEWVDNIVDYFDPLEEAKVSLEARAGDSCQLTEAYFYEAYKHWLTGNSPEAKRYLEKTLNSAATLYSEYLWAKAILGSNLLED